MKLLLDENLPHEFRHLLIAHQVFTVAYMGWAGVNNGELLKRAADAGFDVMITMDDGISHQQNKLALPIALCILTTASNDIDDLKPLLVPLLAALQIIAPKTVVRVP